MIELLVCWLPLSRKRNVTRLTLTIQTSDPPTVHQWIWGRSCDLYVCCSAEHARQIFPSPLMWKWNDRPADTERYWCCNLCGSGAIRFLRLVQILAFYNINNPPPTTPHPSSRAHRFNLFSRTDEFSSYLTCLTSDANKSSALCTGRPLCLTNLWSIKLISLFLQLSELLLPAPAENH